MKMITLKSNVSRNFVVTKQRWRQLFVRRAEWKCVDLLLNKWEKEKGMQKRILLALALVVCLIASTAGAQTLINPANISSFPYTISKPGSYILTGNINVTTTGTNAININTTGVTLDLNGFSITGPLNCTSGGCTPNVVSGGIISNYPDTTIRNGHISGFYECVSGFDHAKLSDLSVNSCMYGVFAYNESIVEHATVRNCAAYAIVASQSLVTESTVSASNTGIYSMSSSIVRNVVSNIQFDGIYLTSGGLAANNLFYGNGTDEIADGSKIIYDNNACTAGSC